MRDIILHGALRKKYGKKYTLNVNTAAEAVRALSANFPEFAHDIRNGSWHVVKGEHIDKGFDLDEQDFLGLSLGRSSLHIAPYIGGSKRGGLLKVILGVAMIATGFVFGGMTWGSMVSTKIAGGAVGGLTYGNMAIMGTIMALSGISQMLTPEKQDEDDQQSYIFSGPGNTSTQGNAVPLVYGECMAGGVLVSGGIDVEQIAASGGGGSRGKK